MIGDRTDTPRQKEGKVVVIVETDRWNFVIKKVKYKCKKWGNCDFLTEHKKGNIRDICCFDCRKHCGKSPYYQGGLSCDPKECGQSEIVMDKEITKFVENKDSNTHDLR